MSLHCQLKTTAILCTRYNFTNKKLRFIFQMKYGKHLVSTVGNDKLNANFRHLAGYLTCSDNFRGYKKSAKIKNAIIYPHVFEAKTRKFGDAKIFHFTVFLDSIYMLSGWVMAARLLS